MTNDEITEMAASEVNEFLDELSSAGQNNRSNIEDGAKLFSKISEILNVMLDDSERESIH